MTDSTDIAEKAAQIAGEASELSNKAMVLAESALNNHEAMKEVVVTGVDPFIFAITVFVLACFVGYYVVWKVTPALHTPLMSVTNAVSSIIIVGAILAASAVSATSAGTFGIFAILIASINIFGGFIVTQRMLQMFKKKSTGKTNG